MSAAERALDQVLRLTLALEQDMTSSLARVGLTPARSHVLWLLVAEGPSPQVALARALDVTPRNVTGLVDGLERDGFVTREPDPSDRRAQRVTLTPRGREVADGLVAGRSTLAAQLFAGLSAERVESIGSDLELLAARVEALVAEAAG
ncbi:MarR family transcriptional regulator [Nocardioides zeae]|uniref:MarR family transcriptional regulator n=1 Tax=Nocardioides imazamoxiresistens TaxID=3231893 RepID=A0ABU3PWW0_9ACTN|nr:MarR family transcriptional regulator [Nocardioides zeae]MDT9593671.1 MarR family transcriptional regulator [Nocardioides zeae]